MNNRKQFAFNMLSLMGQLGFYIAIPAVVFGFGGAYLDRWLGTSPLFVLSGLALAIASSSLAIYQLIKRQ